MSGNPVIRGYSLHNKLQAQIAKATADSALEEALQAKSDAETADTKAQQGIDDASTAQSKGEEAEGKAESAQESTDEAFNTSKTSRDSDMEALLQELVINSDAPEGQFILGTDDGYFQYDSENSEYREVEYPEGQDLDGARADNNATAFELVKRDGEDQDLYLMIEDDDGLYIVNHSDGSREAIDDVLDGTSNDRSDAESKDFESGKNPLNYVVKLTFAPSKAEHVRDLANIRSVHLRALDELGQPRKWLYAQGEDKRLESQSMSNVDIRRLYIVESGQAE